MSELLAETSRAWEQAALGNSPISVAAFMSNAVFAMFEEVEQRLKLLCDSSNLATLLARCSPLRDHVDRQGDTKTTLSQNLSQVHDLQVAWEALAQFKEARQSGEPTRARLRSSQITVRRGRDSAPMDRDCFAIMVGDIGHHINAGKRPSSVVLAGTPVFADIGYLLTHEENDNNGLRCSFGLHMLLRAYKGFLLSSHCAHPPSGCRLQALRFAQEVASNIAPVLKDSTMPCRYVLPDPNHSVVLLVRPVLSYCKGRLP